MKYEIYVGNINDMQTVATRGVRGLNPKTHRWQIVSASAQYEVIKDPKIPNGASLFSNEDLRSIAAARGLIL